MLSRGGILVGFSLKNFYILNKRKKYLIMLSVRTIFLTINDFDSIQASTYGLHIDKMLYLTKVRKSSLKKLNDFFKSNNNFFLKKLKFFGKGFKIKKTRNKISFLFNKSHKVFIVVKNVRVLKLRKNKICMIGKKKIHNISTITRNIMTVNRFTKKGIKISKQLVRLRKK